jgi:hypothetical protein
MIENNSEEMNTVVETFLVEETMSLIYDNDKLDKWNNLVAELGLEGQNEIRHPEKSPIPFMHLKTSLFAVFNELCSTHVDVKNFRISPIPVEILDLISLSIREKYFSEIQIWYDEKVKDPCCVGIIKSWGIDDSGGRRVGDKAFKFKEDALEYIQNNNMDGHKPYDYSFNSAQYYLIGKWADVKHSFDELKKMAKERFIERKGYELKKTIKEKQRELDDLELESINLFS